MRAPVPSSGRPRRFWRPLLALTAANLVCAQAAATPPGWTDLADLALASPAVFRATADKVSRIAPRAAPDVPPGQVRALVEVSLVTVLAAPGLLPARAEWLWQGPADKGRPPFAAGAPVLVFAEPVAGGPKPEVQQMRLVAPHAQVEWTAAREADVRAILAAALKPGARGLMVTGVIDGQFAPGPVAGLSESQVFLATEGGGILTLVVARRPNEVPRVRVADGDIIERAIAVQPQTLLWRALACGMPDALPPGLAANSGLAADYALARAEVGACGRTMAGH
jgi:hypothetical protein